MHDLKDWYRAKIRQNVVDEMVFTDTFKKWREGCSGKIIPGKSFGDRDAIYFEHKEDLVAYLLTFDEKFKFSSPGVSARIIDW